QWSVEHAHHRANLDLLRWPRQAIAAALALAALHEARIAQVRQDRVEEFLGNVVGRRDVAHQRQLSRGILREMNEGLEAVFSLGGEHGRTISRAGVGPEI